MISDIFFQQFCHKDFFHFAGRSLPLVVLLNLYSCTICCFQRQNSHGIFIHYPLYFFHNFKRNPVMLLADCRLWKPWIVHVNCYPATNLDYSQNKQPQCQPDFFHCCNNVYVLNIYPDISIQLNEHLRVWCMYVNTAKLPLFKLSKCWISIKVTWKCFCKL